MRSSRYSKTGANLSLANSSSSLAFVYGTLKQGFSNHWLIEDMVGDGHAFLISGSCWRYCFFCFRCRRDNLKKKRILEDTVGCMMYQFFACMQFLKGKHARPQVKYSFRNCSTFDINGGCDAGPENTQRTWKWRLVISYDGTQYSGSVLQLQF